MRSSRWVPVTGWFVATATSIVLSWVALLPVLNAARADVGALPDVDQVPAAEFAAQPTAAPARPAPPSTSPTPGKTVKPTKKPSKKTTSPPAETRTPTAPATPTTPATVENGWTVTTGGDGVQVYVRSFTVKGGQAVVKMTGAGVVSLVTATPADGYTVEKTQSSPDDMAVYFNETGHSFIIRAIWWNNAPFAEVSEIGS
ncbi:DNA mismatch repair protein MutL [Actinoplanes oblitus]|uniref:DNA mismatch repair protein MutL n=1 Tax=Actinoplanes oblitus TaxID=3040509 RepID=A0ABY8WEQ6_9ACTN|nr:DNA mismatch repair protein MutL [Actinoplanes oblitus]WIM96336.1 DNA mismatch repair protein MutL [Actinoplanes oblitus]